MGLMNVCRKQENHSFTLAAKVSLLSLLPLPLFFSGYHLSPGLLWQCQVIVGYCNQGAIELAKNKFFMMGGLVCVLIPIPTIYNGFFEVDFEQTIAWHKFLSLPARPGGVGTIFWYIVTYPSESFSHCTSIWILHSLLCCLSVAFRPATLTYEVVCPWVVLYTCVIYHA